MLRMGPTVWCMIIWNRSSFNIIVMMAVVTKPVATAVAAVVRTGVSDLFFVCFSRPVNQEQSPKGEESSVGKASDWKARRNADAGSSPRCGKGFFSQGQLPVQTVWRVRTAPSCNRMHQQLCARKNKSQVFTAIPLSGHTQILYTLTGMGNNTTHTDSNG